MGGLGNQLHCYAMGRAVAFHNDAELIVDTESGYWSDPYGRKYVLHNFPRLSVRKMRHFHAPGYRIAFKIWLKAAQWMARRLPLSRAAVVQEGSSTYFRPELLHTQYRFRPYLIGYWASYRYYEGIESELRSSLTPPKPEASGALEILDQIEQSNSCMIHWRSYAEEAGINRPNMRGYYQKALAVMREKHPDTHFFVFSDRPDMLDGALDTDSQSITVVNLQSMDEDAQALAEFYLMFRCRHAIIGDSTFSWWAAWLGEQKDKLVIAPSGLSPWGRDWTPPDWASISVDRNS